MIEHLEQGVVWVKQHAEQYGIDMGRIGLTGASAGGHLASLLAVKNLSSDVRCAADVASVKAVGVFFPPHRSVAIWTTGRFLRLGHRYCASRRVSTRCR